MKAKGIIRKCLLLTIVSLIGLPLRAQVYNLHLGFRTFESPGLVLGIENSLSRHGSLLAELSFSPVDAGTNQGKSLCLSVFYRHGIYQSYVGPYLEGGLTALSGKKKEPEDFWKRSGAGLAFGAGYSRMLSRHWSLDFGARLGLFYEKSKHDHNPLDLFQDRTIYQEKRLRLGNVDLHMSLNYLF